MGGGAHPLEGKRVRNREKQQRVDKSVCPTACGKDFRKRAARSSGSAFGLFDFFLDGKRPELIDRDHCEQERGGNVESAQGPPAEKPHA